MRAYLRLLLTERLNALRMLGGQSGRTAAQKTKHTLKCVGIALIALMVLSLVVGAEYLLLQAFSSIGAADTFLQLVFLVCMLTTLLVSFFFVLSSLFFSKDVLYVAALPLSSRKSFATRLTMVLLGEAGISLAISLPAIVMYGAMTGAPWDLYLRAVLFTPWLSALPIAVVTLLSFLLIRCARLWKRREGLTTIASFVLMAVFLFFYMRFVSQASNNAVNGMLASLLSRNSALLTPLLNALPPVRWIDTAIRGSGWTAYGMGLLFVGAGVACLGLIVWLLGGGYQALAIQQTEAIAAVNRGARRSGREAGCHSPVAALCRRELKDVFTTPIYATNSLCGAVMFPVMLLAFYFASGSEVFAELKPLMGMLNYLPRALVLAVATAVFCLTCSMNMAVSTSVSREGKRSYFSHVIPVAPGTVLRAKLWMGMILNVICSVPMAIVCVCLLPMFWAEILLGLIVAQAFSLLTCSLAITLDAARPNFHWRSETEAIKQSVNGMLSMLICVVLLAGLVLGFIALTRSGVGATQTYWTMALLLAVLAFAGDRLMIRRASVRYSLQEK